MFSINIREKWKKKIVYIYNVGVKSAIAMQIYDIVCFDINVNKMYSNWQCSQCKNTAQGKW